MTDTTNETEATAGYDYSSPAYGAIPEGFDPGTPDYINAGSEQAMVPTTTQSTQVAHPGKATARTLFAYILAALIAGAAGLPLIADALDAYLPPSVTRVVIAAGVLCGVLVTLFTRLMAVPAVNEFLALLKLDAHK